MKKIITSILLVCMLLSIIPPTAVEAEDSFRFELPLKGTTGYASVQLDLLSDPGLEKIATIGTGVAFTILMEKGDYFWIKVPLPTGGSWYGLVKKDLVMVNLPDLIPSIIYWDSNSISSMFESSGVTLPGVTEMMLYNVKFYNPRFQKEEFTMPVMYNMAKQIMMAQQAALADGNCLKIYETYRPYKTQELVRNSLSNLISTNSKVKNGISSWGQGWFISSGISNHQRGRAMDCSLVQVLATEERNVNGYSYSVVTDYKEYQMPTRMHELSCSAATFKYGVSKDAWRSAPLSTGFKSSEGAMLLQKYCTDAGMTPLASEWWHFDASNCPSSCKGDFYLSRCVSEIP